MGAVKRSSTSWRLRMRRGKVARKPWARVSMITSAGSPSTKAASKRGDGGGFNGDLVETVAGRRGPQEVGKNRISWPGATWRGNTLRRRPRTLVGSLKLMASQLKWGACVGLSDTKRTSSSIKRRGGEGDWKAAPRRAINILLQGAPVRPGGCARCRFLPLKLGISLS